ncbi:MULTISPECIES: hypothetical protein [unclassified Bacillus (in: firmicutes)]|uniref:hypothetical protein n=1 Tax=unclassified Bacillus (in: firmicutes) TaxID=185979 RepID=UPI000330894B|nr:hypothetical protein ICS_03870 [Bacillus cereus BAG2O-3]EOQ13647.1 hypothetical protein KQ3_01013 [Bacillus cereus B5-2]PFI48888.1 hypothetical protein COI76_24510 [Bacillus cereus]PFW86402.1 hypothetical protein COL27_04105 [Bacillus sp. AFS075960]RFB48078.1 hypothetical protein DZB83_12765 [Bacillus sp. dmp10]
MMHYSKEDWRNYTLDFIESNERESMEEHLYECDHCLALYMESIDEQHENLPMINDDSFTNEVMTQINFEILQSNENIKTNSLKRTIIHYIIATAATIIFMVSGLFQYIFTATSNFEKSSKHNESSISQQIVNKSVDTSKKNGGSKHE